MINGQAIDDVIDVDILFFMMNRINPKWTKSTLKEKKNTLCTNVHIGINQQADRA